MYSLPPSLTKLINALQTLPGVGPRSAERYAYYLLRSNPANAQNISESTNNLKSKISYCKKTFALVETGQEVSPLYSDPKRDKTTVAVVAEPFDIMAIEATGAYQGTYHVLGGLISPIDNINPEQLTIKQLLDRIKEDSVKELILATNASVEGESTALYIKQQVKDKTNITRLARGLPIGIDLEYADQITLTRALEGRQAI